MPDFSPWSLARRADRGRSAVLLLALAALLYVFGMHAARACGHVASATVQHSAAASPCHDEADADVDFAQAACEAHCRTDAQTGRVSPSFDLPAAAPLCVVLPPAPPAAAEPLTLAAAPPRGDTGPPLHILLHRLLR